MIDEIADQISELEQDDEVKINGLVLSPETEEAIRSKYVDDGGSLLGYDYVVSELVDEFSVCFVNEGTRIGLPMPERVDRMVENVSPTDADNIVFGKFDLFADLTGKYVDLDDEAMDEADVEYEGEKEFVYDDPETSHMETVRFKDRVEAPVDTEKGFDELADELREKLAESVKKALYSGRRVDDIKVNEPVPDDVDPEEDEWIPDRVKVGENVVEFKGVLLGNEDEKKVETVEAEES